MPKWHQWTISYSAEIQTLSSLWLRDCGDAFTLGPVCIVDSNKDSKYQPSQDGGFFFTPWCHFLKLPRALCIAGKCHDNCYKRISCEVDLARLHTRLAAHNNDDSQWHLSNQEGKHERKGTASATRKQQLYVSTRRHLVRIDKWSLEAVARQHESRLFLQMTGPVVAPCFDVSVSVRLGYLGLHCGASAV